MLLLQLQYWKIYDYVFPVLVIVTLFGLLYFKWNKLYILIQEQEIHSDF